MHSHDLDLIASHASGLLSGADETRAAELIGSCEVCASEFSSQRQIRSLLAAAPTPAMSEFERTRMRRAVLDAVARPTPAVSPWQRRFMAIAGAAAAVLVVVVGVGVGGLFGGDDAGDLVAAESATTAAAADAPMDESDATMSALSDHEESERAAADDADGAVMTMQTQMVDISGFDDPDALDSVLAELTALAQELGEPVSIDDAIAFGATCAAAVEGDILGLVLASVDGVPTQVFLVGDPAEPTTVMLATAEC
ncbi:MAG: hypothetical protein WD532_07330 [Acidimicrobiia bacterium]